MTMRILVGDARERLRELPDESVHCVVTSPPYYGLRDYGTAQWDDGDAECDHSGIRRGHGDEKQSSSAGTSRDPVSRDCRRCGAKRIDRQIGLEPSPAEYVETLVAVFREVRRVLRKDGTLWLNLGDSYANTGNKGQDFSASKVGYGGVGRGKIGGQPVKHIPLGCKPKDLLGIPWTVAFALRADGWWLRQDIIWSKPNPMPESVTDRCTKAHEYLFLLSKSERYWFDQESIKEACSPNTHARVSQDLAAQVGSFRANGGNKTNGPMKAVIAGSTRKIADAGSGIANNRSYEAARALKVERRNRRSVWEIPALGFSEAHFATFPPALVEPCILAGCPKSGTVLDPFFGAGTTGIVADRLGRDCIGIELNPAYAEMTRARLVDDAGMFANVEVAA